MPVTWSDEKLILLYCPGRGSNSRPPAHRSFKHVQGVLRPYPLGHCELWGCCGRHNSPPASSVMDFIFCCSTQSLHHCFSFSLLLPGGTHRRTGQHQIGGSNPVLPEWSRTNVLSFARINVISARIGGSTTPLIPVPYAYGGTISRVFLPVYSWSFLFAFPNHLVSLSCTSL